MGTYYKGGHLYMESNFQKNCKTSFCGIHKDYFRFVLIFIFVFSFFVGEKVLAATDYGLEYGDNIKSCLKIYSDLGCTQEIGSHVPHSLPFDGEENGRCIQKIYVKFDANRYLLDGDPKSLLIHNRKYRYKVDGPIYSIDSYFSYSQQISPGLYEMHLSLARNLKNNGGPDYFMLEGTNLKAYYGPKLSGFNNHKGIQFYKEESCRNKIDDSHEVLNGSVIYAKVDLNTMYIIGNEDSLKVNLIYGESGYSFYTESKKVPNSDSVYKITFREENNNFVTGGQNLTIANINLTERTDYNINFKIPENMLYIYESDETGNKGSQILTKTNSYTQNILMRSRQTRYFLIMPHANEGKYIKEGSLGFSYIACGFKIASKKISSDDGGTYLVTVSDDLEYGESSRQSNVNSIFVKVDFLTRSSFYINFPSVHGIEFVDSSNITLSGKKWISDFSGEYKFSAKIDENIFQGNNLKSVKNIQFSLGDNFDMQSEYDSSTNVFSFNILSYKGKENESYTLSLLVNYNDGTKKSFVKLSIPTDNYVDTVKFYYLESNGVLSANNYRIIDEILVFPGIDFNLYVRVDVDGEYDIDTLSLKITNSTIEATSTKQEGSDYGKAYYYNKYRITSLFNDANISVELDQKKYNISLLKKIAGLEQVEYEVNYLNQNSLINHGSTSGRDYASLRKGEKINFIFKFNEKGYNQIEMENLKLNAYFTDADGSADKSKPPKQLNIGKKEEIEITDCILIDKDSQISEIKDFEVVVKESKTTEIKDLNGVVLENYKLTNEEGEEITGYKLLDGNGTVSLVTNFSLTINNNKVINIKDSDESLLENHRLVNLEYHINNEGKIDVSQKYYSEQYEVEGHHAIFEIEGVNKDKHKIEIITDDEFENENYDITQLVNILPNDIVSVVSKDEGEGQDNKYKKYVVEDQEYGSYLDFLIKFKNEEPGTGYDQSIPQVSGIMTGSTNNVNISQKADGYWRLKIAGDSTLTVNKIARNNYKVTVPQIGGITFKYKKVDKNYTGAESLEGYENFPRNSQVQVEYEDYLAIVADFDYSVGLDMDKMEINDDKITVNFDGENFKGFVVPRINNNYNLDVSVPLRSYNVSFTKIDGNMARAYDNSGNVLNIGDYPAIKLIHGSDYKFKVDVDYKYSKSQSNMEVVLLNDINSYRLKKNDEEIKTFMLEVRSGEITGIKDLDGNSDYIDYVLVNDQGEEIKISDCNLKDRDGKIITINSLDIKVKYGKVIEIKNYPNGSVLTNYTLTYHSSDEILSPDDDGNYNLSYVSASADILVRGLKLNRYNLTFQNTNLITFTEFIEDNGYKLIDESGNEVENFKIEIKEGIVKAVRDSEDRLLENYKLTDENEKEINSYKLVDKNGKDSTVKSFSILIEGGKVTKIKDTSNNLLEDNKVVIEQNIGGAKDFEKKSVIKEVTINDTFKFNYKLSEGYSLEGAEITNNGEALRKSDGIYIIYDISEDMNIVANDLSKVKYRLTFVSESGVSFTDNYGESISSVTTEYSSNYSFRVIIDNKYSQSEDNMEVYYLDSENKEVSLKRDVSGAYTVRNITSPIDIRVKGINMNVYKVSLPINSEGVIFQIGDKRSDDEDISEFEKKMNINHGENFKFSVLAATGYDVSNIQMSISSTDNKVTVDVVNDGYMIQNVSENLELAVSGVKRKSHTVTLIGDNIKFKSDAGSSAEINGGSIDYEVGQLSFIFLPEEGFEMVDDYEFNWKDIIKVSPTGFYTDQDDKPSDTSKKPVFLKRNEGDNESYTVSEVTDDITITINGAVKKKTFKVVFPDVEGIKYLKFEDGSSAEESSGNDHELPLENIVGYDDTFRFEVKAEYGYDISSMQIRYGVNNYLSAVNGMYYINNIRSNITLEVLYVNKNNYNVKFKGQNITFYDEDNKNPITDASVKYESGIFKFRLRPNIGYDLDLANVVFEINGVEYDHKKANQDPSSPIVVQGPDDSEVFTISNVNKSVTLVARGSTKQKYQIHFPIDTEGIRFAQDRTVKDENGDDKKETVYLNETEIAEYLSEFKFYVIPRKGHNTDSLNVTVDPVNSADIDYIDGGYTLSMIQGDFYINVSNVGKNNYKVSFEGDGAEFFNSSNIKVNNVSVQYGSSYEFKIQSADGYDVGSGYILHMYNPLNPNDRVTINNRYNENSKNQADGGHLNDGEDNEGNPIIGTALSESGRLTYQISNLQDNMVIRVEDVAKNRYNIFFPSVLGIEFTNMSDDSKEVIHGGTFSFKIKELEGYTIKNVKVWANSNAVDLINGQYTINDIINDIVISVDGVQSTKVDFKFQYINGVIYKDTNDGILSTLDTLKINNGSSYSFKVDLSADYSDSLDKMEVYANREKKEVIDGNETTKVVKEKIQDIRGIYTVQNITESTTITVEKVEINSYNIKLTETTGIEYLDKYGDKKLDKEEKISHGESFSFMVNPVKGFIGSDVIVTAKGQNIDKVQLTPIDGVYTIDNVQSDYTVVVENVNKAIYKVEVRLLDGVNLLDDSGNKLSTSLTVKHGDDLSFRLSLDEAYSNSVPEVVVKGSNNKITPMDNVYTVKSIENDTIIEVSNVRKNTYIIKFKETEGVIYKNAKNKVFTDSLEVEYGGSLQFKVALKDAYDASIPLVLLNDKDAITQSGGTYELFNVRDNGEITVKNVVKNNESSVIEMVEEIDEQINSADNTTSVIEASKKYNALTDDEKELLTNVSKLKNAQEQVAKIHHTSNGVTVTGIDWNIKVEAIPMDYDQETVDRLSEKMERKSVVSLYEIKLVNTLTGEKYEIPYGSEVSVSIPAPNLEGYQNEVVVHENSVGSIEYLDVLINEGTANFTTKSFSIFGIAAKEVPNYSKNSSDVTISVEGLLKDSDVELEDLMYNGLDSQLGDLTGGSGFGSGSNGSSSGNNGSSSGSGISGNGNSGSGNNGSNESNSSSGGNAASSELNTGIAAVDNTYSWIINNEFIIVISLVGIIVIGVSIFLIRTRNKENS